MSDGAQLSAADFGAAFKGFLEQAVSNAPPVEEPFFLGRLTRHFGSAAGSLPIVSEPVAPHDHVNLQLALDDYLGEGGRTHELLGVSSYYKRMMGIGLGDLASQARSSGLSGMPAPEEGPVDYVNLAAGEDAKLACVHFGLFLISDGESDRRLAVLVHGADTRGFGGGVAVDVMSPDRADAERFLADLRGRMRARNVYRGRIVSLSVRPPMGALEVKFHHLPPVDRDGIVLPTGVLERIERQTLRFAALSERLRAAGRHLKRGLLLWGPPERGRR